MTTVPCGCTDVQIKNENPRPAATLTKRLVSLKHYLKRYSIGIPVPIFWHSILPCKVWAGGCILVVVRENDGSLGCTSSFSQPTVAEGRAGVEMQRRRVSLSPRCLQRQLVLVRIVGFLMV